ncbi:hypothetical protein PHYSODRAFT_253852 [Phytophthora sojae]|uniref:MYND-type domain-containing protein n=1 Tax=Phytophthora sojae (strain P6497) TaxID=1094619 RepID=G4YR81_PHYSP|nr:hypothetical protein PHYSODRAFT_253852 [Phytophthora sojae]EGZ22815.1 hypothetical protein PHYSODRAFT_253852 [Phytophthora sojae]|eukprot:XP_009518103.1 hypothetical protein PHYSODRAFT_253852 [Phytophthora sojae]
MQSACQVCGPRGGVSPEALFKCSRCQGVLYCGREHQTADFPNHKAICKRVKKFRDLMAEEEHKICNAEPDMFTPANAFETEVGLFWGVHSTRPYMRAKVEVIRTLSLMDARPGTEAALAEAMGSLRLCRGDNVGIRELVPTRMLLLGQYQEAYDDYDWGDMDLPYLDVHGADMTEEIPERIYAVFFITCLTHIKMTLANAVKDAITAHELADHASLPAGVTDSLGAFLAPNGQTRSLKELKELHKKLTRQTPEAFALAHSLNSHFWPVMLDPFPLRAWSGNDRLSLAHLRTITLKNSQPWKAPLLLHLWAALKLKTLLREAVEAVVVAGQVAVVVEDEELRPGQLHHGAMMM